MKRQRASLAAILTITLILVLIPMTALAADTTIDLETIANGTTGAGYAFSGGVLTLSGRGPFIITTNGNTVIDRTIVVSPGVTADMTLNNVKIDVSAASDACALDMAGATVNLTLTGANTLKSGANRAGLEVPSGAALTVTANSTGRLTASGGSAGAGIGGGFGANCGTVTVRGGEITAVGKTYYADADHDTVFGGGAGIGGGGCEDTGASGGGNSGAIIIDGGTVNATGGSSAAGIGSGCSNVPLDGGSVTIKSGTVTAEGAYGGAGIGGGWCGDGGSIAISGGTVTATSPEDENPVRGLCGGAGIGGGTYGNSAGDILITGGTVTAGTEGMAAGIGTGFNYLIDPIGGSVRIEGGTVTATGGSTGAGIGSGCDVKNSIPVTITGGRVSATGGLGGAGIGGGYHGDGGTITITGGDITAVGRGGEHKTLGLVYGAGIGGGSAAEAGAVTISGGSVKATGAYGGAGIGGEGGSIEISGGTVTATGGDHGEYFSDYGGAGIGGTGYGSGSMAMTLSGGTVYAEKGADAQNDIGYGVSGTGVTLNISGSAAVFLKNDSCVEPNTATHAHYPFAGGTSEAYGIAVPSAWTSDFGAYLRLVTLSYSLNNGSGTAPSPVTRNYQSPIAVSDGSGITRSCYELSGWNTAADGSGTACALGGTYTVAADTTLYAQWTAQPALASSVGDATVYVGGRIILTPNIEGGTWNWDHDFFTATFNSPATFTALKAGTSAITYTVDGVTVRYEVTVEASELPLTGQDFTWAWVLAALASAAGAAGAVLRRRRTRA